MLVAQAQAEDRPLIVQGQLDDLPIVSSVLMCRRVSTRRVRFSFQGVHGKMFLYALFHESHGL